MVIGRVVITTNLSISGYILLMKPHVSRPVAVDLNGKDAIEIDPSGADFALIKVICPHNFNLSSSCHIPRPENILRHVRPV